MTDQSDLLSFLRERLDEDKRRAHKMGHFNPEQPSRWPCPAAVGTGPCDCGQADRRARALREVEAKRRIIDLHPHVRFAEPPSYWRDIDCGEMREAFPGDERPYHQMEVYEPDWWCEHVRALASVYSGHPGYRQEWAP